MGTRLQPRSARTPCMHMAVDGLCAKLFASCLRNAAARLTPAGWVTADACLAQVRMRAAAFAGHWEARSRCIWVLRVWTACQRAVGTRATVRSALFECIAIADATKDAPALAQYGVTLNGDNALNTENTIEPSNGVTTWCVFVQVRACVGR